MAEQISRRSNNVTAAPFDAPFETHTVRFGAGSLNLKDSLDAMEGWSRLTNIWHENEGEATPRPGLTRLSTHGAGIVNAVRKLRNPMNGSASRASTAWARTCIAASLARPPRIDAGYSGHPLTLCPHRAPAQRGRVDVCRRHQQDARRCAPTGSSSRSACPRLPRQPPRTRTSISRVIAMCDATDGTPPAAWVPAPGTDSLGAATNPPLAATAVPGPIAGNGIYLITDPGAVTKSDYDSWWGIPLTRDLTTLGEVGGSGTVDATDQDLVHLWMATSHPSAMAEIRLYLVISPTFDPLILPGTDEAATANRDAYVKAFRPNDYVQFVQANQSQVQAAEQARVYALRDLDGKLRSVKDDRDTTAEVRAQSDPGRARSYQLGLGSNQWFGYGMLGSPLRRGDFQRIGSTEGRDWSTVTGVIIYVRLLPTSRSGRSPSRSMTSTSPVASAPTPANRGCRATTTAAPTTTRAPAPRATGATSSPDAVRMDPLRRQVAIDPAAYGDAAIRQRLYRRGGSLFDDWYFVGENTSDGAVLLDGFTDEDIIAAGTLPDDHFQPVPTITTGGDTVLAQPVPAIWGPLEGMLFACGDPHRPGHVYYSLQDEPDHWSAFGNVEVCPPSEELMHGGLLGHQGFVFSRARLYFLYPNLGGAQGVTASPSLCTARARARAGRFARVLPALIFFVAEDGIFATDGGAEDVAQRSHQPALLRQRGQRLQPDRQVARRVRRAAPHRLGELSLLPVPGHRRRAAGPRLLAAAEVLAALRLPAGAQLRAGRG